MKRVLLLFVLVFVVILSALTMTACGDIFAFLNGNTGADDDGEAPIIIGLETIKAEDGYLESQEYLYNSKGTNPMALTFSERYYLVIRYKNDSGKTISSVKVTWKDSKEQTTTQTFSRDAFAPGSGDTATYIEFVSDDESKMVSNSTMEYTVNTVLYMSGSSTSKMSWDDGVSKSIKVALRPYFTLSLDYMNADLRRGKETVKETKDITRVYYKEDLNKHVSSADFTGQSPVPTKEGGWVFVGWYTQPNGQGLLVTSSSTFDFWSDTKLYAYYERMYKTESIVALEKPIVHSYKATGTGADQQITFTSGVVLQNNGKNKSDSVCSNYYLEIPDTIVNEKYTISEKIRNDGMTIYDVNVTGTEYPVVRLDRSVFEDFNTITSARMGKYVEEIGYRAFSGCEKMETISFAEDSTLKYIGDFAFENATTLGQSFPFTLPSTVEYLGMCAFRYSGWGVTRNDGSGGNSSELHIPTTWKYIGFKCFANTRFTAVVFKAGCHFDDQVSKVEGDRDESAGGSRTIRTGQNKIGACLFSMCYRLTNVTFDSNGENGLNIIPDYCFDAGSWTGTSDKRDGAFQCISYIAFGEGLTYIGQRAFNYQERIPQLSLPKSLEVVDRYAFYNCISVTNLNFEHVDQNTLLTEGVKKALTTDSKLTTVKTAAFANLTGIDVVYITSEYFALYGNGVFQGCSRLKCVIFYNMRGIIPTGFKSSNPKFGYSVAAGDVINDDEVLLGHEQSDFLYGTAESGEKEQSNLDEEFAITYTSPVRLFCPTEYTDAVKSDMLIGKRVTAGNTSSGTKSYNSQIFIHPLDNLYEYTYNDGKDEIIVSVAVQEVKIARGLKPTSNVAGYSLVYWSARSTYIELPTKNDLSLGKDIIEIAAYAIPTSVQHIYIPNCYTRLEHDAFNGCSSLTNVEFEDIDTLEYVGQYAFFGTSIPSFTGGNNLKVIGSYAFERCESLRWVDLRNTPIKNTYNGRMAIYTLYKYEYELEDYEEDFNDCLGYNAFQFCSNLEWIYLPPNIMQLCMKTFYGCDKLRHVIIPTARPSTDTTATSNDCFYERGEASLVFNSNHFGQMSFYVASSATEIHRKLLDPLSLYGGIYNLIDVAPAHP